MGGKRSAKNNRALPEARPAQQSNCVLTETNAAVVAANKGMHSAPIPKKMPNTFQIGPRLSGYKSEINAMVEVLSPPPPHPSSSAGIAELE